MQSIYKTIILLIILLSTTSCEKPFDELNNNPNAPEVVAPQFLLSNVIYEAADNNAVWGWKAGNLIGQYTSNLEFLPVDRYDLGSNTELWNDSYRLLNDLKSINELEGTNEAYQGISKVLKAYIAATLTDLWTDVPYSDALKGKEEGNFTPSYDRQEDIYLADGGILDLLRQAAIQLKDSEALVNGDILYNGNLQQWVKFANALRVRYLLRISNKVDVSEELQTLVAEEQLFDSPQDNAQVAYLASAPNQWFIFNEREGRYADLRMSATIDSVLHAFNDPRIATFFKPTVESSNSGNPIYKGLPNGLSRDSQNAFSLSNISLLGSIFRDVPNGVAAVFMTYSEQQFALAEAAEKGWISGSAVDYYQSAIQANFADYQVAMPADYFDQANVALDGNDHLNKILTQKWLSLILVGYEGWYNFRRTGLPALQVPKDNLNNNVFPARYRYPGTEQAVNGTNYTTAVNRIGGDDYNQRGWWGE